MVECGSIFGSWKVLSLNGSTKHMVPCECLGCGKRKEIYRYHLINGNSRSCHSCASKLAQSSREIKEKLSRTRKTVWEKTRDKRLLELKEKFMGRVFHNWTVVNVPDIHFMDVKCLCGTTKTLRKTHLLYGKSRSCGCARRELLKDSFSIGRRRKCAKSGHESMTEEVKKRRKEQLSKSWTDERKQKQRDYLNDRDFCLYGCSKESIDFFEKLQTNLNRPLKFGERNEKIIKHDENIYFYDCYDAATNTVIEYHGSYWHRDTTDRDEFKKELALMNGYNYEVVWDYEREEKLSFLTEKMKA
jgi:hypothetical protein